MPTISVFYISLALLLAILIVYFQYFYKKIIIDNSIYLLTFLRFFSIFSLLLLLLNPKVRQKSYEKIKPNLLVAIDNSSSIKFIHQDSLVQNLIQTIKSDSDLNRKFDIETYGFSTHLEKNENITFDKNKTNLYNALRELNELYEDKQAPIVILSDGNQTYGNSYTYFQSKQKIYPIVIGDTTSFTDLYINRINVNAYAYVNNNFPVEIFVNYQGKNPVKSTLEIINNDKVIYKENLNFSNSINSIHKTIKLPPLVKGKHHFKAEIKSLPNERNKMNNIYNFSIEILDEKAEILLLYDVLHPDIGFWKKTVKSNQQKNITIRHISKYKGKLSEYQFVILFQPSSNFKNVLADIKKQGTNFLLQTGTNTDWNFLNSNQDFFSKNFNSSIQNVSAFYNNSFSTFQTPSIDFNKLPPLQSTFGDININYAHQDLLFQGINNIKTDIPLLSIMLNNKQKGVLLFAENIFTWRSNSYLNTKSFEHFDGFMHTIFQFLQDSKKRKRLEVKYAPYYFANDDVKINANYYDSNFVFDKNANIEVEFMKIGQKNKTTLPMIFKDNSFEVQLGNLAAGDYKFIVKSTNERINYQGSFKVLEYSVEQQNIQSNFDDLQKISKSSGGEVFLSSQIDAFLNSIKQSENYAVFQKETIQLKSLINWKWLLALIVVSLSLEWFIRKYKGLI